MPFDDVEEKPTPSPVKGVKLNNNQSVFKDSIRDNEANQNFDGKADRAFLKNESYKQKGYDLAIRFRKLIEDQTLRQNKTELSNKIEKDVLTELVKLAVDMNKDENQEEGMGSMGVIIILLRTCLAQRDQINELSYKFDQLSKEIKK